MLSFMQLQLWIWMYWHLVSHAVGLPAHLVFLLRGGGSDDSCDFLSTAACSEASVHEEKFVLWPRSWVPGRMAAAQSWQNPFICSTWRKLCDWISFYDRRLPSLTGIYPGTKAFSTRNIKERQAFL